MSVHPEHVVTLGVAVAAAIIDHRTGMIPNRLVGGGLVAVMLVRVAGSGSTGFLQSVIGLAVCGLGPLALYICGGLGGGDVKLLAMCGAGLGARLGLEALLYAFSLGALYAIGRVTYEGALLQTLLGSVTLLTNPLLPKHMQRPITPSAARQVRFGPAIASGVAVVLVLHGMS